MGDTSDQSPPPGARPPVPPPRPIPGATRPALGFGPRPPMAPRAPWIGLVPPSASPPAWHPDPSGRHEHRWWDGFRWTHHVGDQGVQGIDEEWDT